MPYPSLINFMVIQIYNHWLSNIKDWCISRQLWWGHRIPVWYIDGKDKEEDYIVARNTDEALEKAHKKYGKDVEIYQDPDVLDTWFSRYFIVDIFLYLKCTILAFSCKTVEMTMM